MTQQQLCNLAQISIERSTANKIDFMKILKEFSDDEGSKKDILSRLLYYLYHFTVFYSFVMSRKELTISAE